MRDCGKIRKKGIDAAKEFVSSQLEKDLRGLKIENLKLNITVAYEPIWAIGTGIPDKPEDSAEMAKFIKSTLHTPRSTLKVIYGGSVTSKNAAAFFAQKEIEGALVGGASLDPDEFGKIAEIASRV